MYLLLKPSSAQLSDFLYYQRRLPFTYQPVGATQLRPRQTLDALPPGFVVDHNRIQLGHGATTFARARTALQHWRMFDSDWLGLAPRRPALVADTLLAILARLPGLWSLNAVRIIYTLDETGDIERFGFAYGSLPDHAAQGEERFTIEWHHEDDSVWYDILAFSQPNQALTRLGYPLMRGLQRRFAAGSLRAMRRAVAR
jgi:uncharacterized protein (UPF0548 family)